uniref:Uncharacterized protein n=1 Tax=Avena sativa TaxID=4498 RepID=A0ACD6AFV1_AVESA
MEDQAKLLADLTAAVSSMNAKLDDIHPTVLDLHSWRPMRERSVESLRAEVGDLRSRVIDVTRSAATSPRGMNMPPLLPLSADAPPTSTPAKPAMAVSEARATERGDDGLGQVGHRDASNYRGGRSGDPESSGGAPAKGTFQFLGPGYDSSDFTTRGWNSTRFPPPPRVDFPLFDGENPRASRLKCEAYFQVCNMHPDTWVNCAAMYFIDDALAWLQSTEAHLHYPVWKEFADSICVQFGKAEFQHHLRSFNRLQQTGTVLESWRLDYRRGDYSSGTRAIPHTALPLPLPPRGKLPQGQKGDDHRLGEAPRQVPQDDKVAALRAYRRARGLCFTCGERWGRDHRCGPMVQLHVVEELLAMVQPKEEPGPLSDQSACDTGSELMHISQAAVEGSQGATTMRFQGTVQNQEVLMLVDSGSSHTFISTELAERLQATTMAISPLRVKVANGGVMNCSQELLNLEWWTQGVQFHTSFKLLPLGSYDIILGFDWLSAHSPMNVHWGNQTMNFQMGGRTVCLHGARADPSKCSPVTAEQMRSLLQKSQVARVI